MTKKARSGKMERRNRKNGWSKSNGQNTGQKRMIKSGEDLHPSVD